MSPKSFSFHYTIAGFLIDWQNTHYASNPKTAAHHNTFCLVMSRIIHRHLHHVPESIVRGEGVYLIDRKGSRYLDASGSAAVTCLGYGHPALLEAVTKQVSNLAYVNSGFFTTDATEHLAAKLANLAPGDLNYIYVSTSGSEAVEAALKMARQYVVETGQPQRQYFISRTHSYHGTTFAALSVGKHIGRRKPFEPLLWPSANIPAYYPYRYKLEHESEHDYSMRTADALEQKIQELGADKVIAFVAETVGGATAGVQPSSATYLQRIREICDRYDILLIFDEVMCGTGRTGTMFASEQYGVQADITTIAKGIGAGVQPIGVTLCTEKLYRTFRDNSGLLVHSGTYTGHATACAAANAVLKVIEEENLLANVQRRGKELIEKLRESLEDHPAVGDIRGIGLFIGIEFVENKSTKEPFDPALKFSDKLKDIAMRNRLLCYPGNGTADGMRGDHVLLAPAYNIDSEHVVAIAERLTRSIDETWREITQ